MFGFAEHAKNYPDRVEVHALSEDPSIGSKFKRSMNSMSSKERYLRTW